MTRTVPTRARRDALYLLIGSGSQDLALRAAQIALPLVVLAETGSVAATGLVAGMAGLPILVSPWWARQARQWVRTGRRLTAVAIFDAFALSVVPAAALIGRVDLMVLVVAGLLIGTGEALGLPGRAALLADVGDRLGADGAIALLNWQDLLRRVGTVVGPMVGAAAVGVGLTYELLWLQAASVLVSGLLAWPVRGAAEPVHPTTLPHGEGEESDLRIRDALRTRPMVLAGWAMRGTHCLTWFAFSLGLAVLGAEQGRPGLLMAWGLTGYGVGSVLGTLVATGLIRRLPVLPLARVAWVVTGLSWVLMGLWVGPWGAAVGGAIAGLSAAVGIGAVTATITGSSAGASRRTLLSGQTVVVSASSSLGMLCGGPVLAAVGVRPTLFVTGLLMAGVAAVVPALTRRQLFLGRMRRRQAADSRAASGPMSRVS